MAVDSGVGIGYSGSGLTGATVTINNLQSGDTLNFTSQSGIGGSYNSGTGVLSLSGSATDTQYQTALESVTFSSASTSTATRSLSIVAIDGSLDSNAAAESVTVGIAVPALAVPFQTTHVFAQSGNPASPAGNLVLVGSTLFGTSPNGGSDNDGAVFSMNADGTDYHVLYSFGLTGTDGTVPVAGLTLVGSTLFGTTETGGSDGDGTVFSINTDGSDYQVLYSFTGTGSDGAEPIAGLTAVGSTLFGTTASGGTDDQGTVFSINTDGSGYQVLYSFLNADTGTDGADPEAGLTAVGSTLFGTTVAGGNNYSGTVFSINTDGSGYQVLYSFGRTDGDGVDPDADLTLVASTLFGTTEGGGSNGQGTVFSINTDGTGYQVLDSFGATGSDGEQPVASLTLAGSTLFGTTQRGGSDGDGTVFAMNGDGTGYHVLYSFTGTGGDGQQPVAGLTLDGSTLFGTTESGGSNFSGVLFSLNTDGSGYQDLQSFGDFDSDGQQPGGGLTLVGSTLFGTTESGGSSGIGTIFSTNSNGTAYDTLYSFGDTLGDGAIPVAGLTLAGSTLFGTTEEGGSDGIGTIFAINTDGTGYHVLYSFTGTGDDGANPVAGLTLVGSTLFGTTGYGGSDGDGTIFSINTNGTGYQVLYSFTGTGSDGASPVAGLTLAGSTLFGTAENGGSNGVGTIFSINPDGTGYDTLYSFGDAPADGGIPVAGLTLVGSTLFGTTEYGGSGDHGTVFSINTDGTGYQGLYSFSGNDGSEPAAALTLVDSTLFGTTQYGGSGGNGTVFSINTDGSQFQVLHAFTDSENNGPSPVAGLTLDGSDLLGTIQWSGYGAGELFSILDMTNYTLGGPAVPVDQGMAVTLASTTTNLDGATVTISPATFQSGDTLQFVNQNDITGSYSNGVLTLTGDATPAQYQTAIQSITFSSTSSNPATREISLVAADDNNTQSSNTVYSLVNVTGSAPTSPPTVTSGGTPALYTAGGNAVTVDGGIKVNSDDTSHMTGATLVISTNEQSGDTLNFNNSNTLGITGSYSSGTLTLSGTASSANYQTALQSVTFNSSSTVTAARSITVQVDDTNASPTSSSTIADTVDVYAPAKVTALYVKGTAWVAGTFESYLGSHTLGNSATPTLGYALQTGANQSKDLPWLNINVIEATFSEQVNVSQSSLVLSGFSSTAYTYPSVTGFSSLGGNTYAWTLSTSLTKNRLEISFLSTGAHAVTDVNGVDGSGAGLSGNWSNGTSTFPSGNGLAGTTSGPNTPTSSDFNFLFNALPGDSARNGTIVNSTDYIDVKNKVNNTTASSNYTPYYDVLGVGAINSTSYIDVKNRVNQSQTPSSNAPGPQDSGVGGLTTTGDDADLTGAMLAVQEGSTGQTGGGAAPAASNQTSGGTSSTSSSSDSSSTGSSSSSSSTGSLASDSDATDAAVSDFDLADLYA